MSSFWDRLRVPLFNEHAELSETLMLLSRIFVEAIDLEALRKDLPVEKTHDEKGGALGSIVVFCSWMEEILGLSKGTENRLKESLQRLQAVRSKVGAAHRFSDSAYAEVVSKLGLTQGASAKSIFLAVARPLANVLATICRELRCTHELWWLE